LYQYTDWNKTRDWILADERVLCEVYINIDIHITSVTYRYKDQKTKELLEIGTNANNT